MRSILLQLFLLPSGLPSAFALPELAGRDVSPDGTCGPSSAGSYFCPFDEAVLFQIWLLRFQRR